jgi:parallel beta-helix repeat protein
MAFCAGAGAQTTLTVTNATDVINGNTTSVVNLQSDDGGDGISYREAITAINQGASNPGAPYTVEFAGDFTINLLLDCAGPTRGGTIIDAGVNTVVFDGQNRTRSGPSLFGAVNCQIRGITVQDCAPAGLLLIGANGTTVQGCTFTDNAAGISLVSLGTVSNCIIGGTDPGAANTITGNNVGVLLDNGSTNITISGNALYANDDANGATTDGIRLSGAANGGITAPVITGLSPLSGTAPANATVELFADDAGQGETFILSTSADGSGNWTSAFGAAASVHEGRNITATATGTTGNTSTFSAPVAVATTAPAVDSITLDGAATTNAQVVSFSVTFSEAVTGIETTLPSDDFTLVGAGLTGPSITAVSGAGASYTVTADIGSGEGTLGLTVESSGGIQDAAGQGLAAPVTGSAVYTIDRIDIDVDLPANIDVTTGDTITLEVEASGPFPLEYQWYKETADKALIEVGTDAPTLEIADITLADEAEYYVEVSDGNETVQSNTAYLHVNVGVPALYLWSMLILALLVAGAALTHVRRKPAEH